jgi:hypothetical protein
MSSPTETASTKSARETLDFCLRAFEKRIPRILSVERRVACPARQAHPRREDVPLDARAARLAKKRYAREQRQGCGDERV